MILNLSTLVRVAGPLKRNSTIIRASANIFTRYIRINCVKIEVSCIQRCATNLNTNILLMLFNNTHPFFNSDLSTFPHKLAHSYYTGNTHATHQDYKDTTNISESKLICRGTRFLIVLLENKNKI